MKIIIVGPAHPYRGGIADTNESFLKSLIDLGHDASIVTFTVQYPEMLFPGKTQFTDDPKPEGLTIDRKINTVNPLNWISTAKYINNLNPDIVVIRYWTPFLAPCLGFIAKRLDSKITKIAMCDNVIPHEHKPWDEALTNYFTSSFDGFITLSETTIKELEQFTNKPKTFFPHPINSNLGEKVSKAEARDRLNLDPEGKYLLFFGLIREYKGLDLTLKALAHPELKAQNVKLIVAGEFYESKEKYLQLIEDLDIQDQVIIHDEFIATSDIKYYFSAADLAIQTYKTASQSGVTLIAFNFDCPILVTDVGGLSEVVIHNQVGFVSPKDPIQIADQIQTFFNQNLFDSISANIAIEKKKYSWETFSNKLIELNSRLK